MEMRNPTRAEVLPNFTPVSCFDDLPGQPPSVRRFGRAQVVAVRQGPERQDDSLKSICSLVERMWLHPAEADMHRPTYEDMMTRALTGCRSTSVQEGLLDALRRVSGRDYVRALASLRALAA